MKFACNKEPWFLVAMPARFEVIFPLNFVPSGIIYPKRFKIHVSLNFHRIELIQAEDIKLDVYTCSATLSHFTSDQSVGDLHGLLRDIYAYFVKLHLA